MTKLSQADKTYQQLTGLPPLPQKRLNNDPTLPIVDNSKKQKDLKKLEAVAKIAQAWKCYSMKKTFYWLKENLKKAVSLFLILYLYLV